MEDQPDMFAGTSGSNAPEVSEAEERVHKTHQLLKELEARTEEVRGMLHAQELGARTGEVRGMPNAPELEARTEEVRGMLRAQELGARTREVRGKPNAQELEARTEEVRGMLRALEKEAEMARETPSADTIRCHEEGDPYTPMRRGPFPQGSVSTPAGSNEREDLGSEVMVQPRARHPDPASHEGLRFPMVGAPVHFKPEPYDGASDWPEYLVYFEQLAEVHGWDHPTMAMVLGLSLKGSARSVLANLTLPQRRDYRMLKNALTQHFCPPQQIHLYQAELKARTRRPNESLTELGRDITRLTRLAYPTADMATRETIGINAFLDAIPGPAIEVRLNVLRGHPQTILEAVALAMEVDALFEAEASKKSGGWKSRIHTVDDSEAPISQLMKAVEKLGKQVQDLSRRRDRPENDKGTEVPQNLQKRPETRSCYNCGEQGHLARDCKKPRKQGNGGGRPRTQ